jgi:hypothetical protein
MAKDDFKRGRRTLRPCYSNEGSSKGDKVINRRIVRKRLKIDARKASDDRVSEN